MSMPRYRSHKVVEAAPIISFDTAKCEVTVDIGDGIARPWTLRVPEDFFARGKPAAGDYLVKYTPDDYLSWSPREAFVEGYTRV
jgi:hypothetical protein